MQVPRQLTACLLVCLCPTGMLVAGLVVMGDVLTGPGVGCPCGKQLLRQLPVWA